MTGSRVAATDDLAATVRAQRAALSLPGLAVGVVRADGTTECATDGFADVATRRPVTDDTVFRIGSVTKPLTAFAVVQCVADGAFALDDPVAAHLRAFTVTGPDPATPGPTVAQLCTHTGGFGEWIATSDLWRRPVRLATGVPRGRRLPPLSEVYGPTVRTAAVPGTIWSYANHGYAVLGQLVEDVTGLPFAEVIAERVAPALGMRRTVVTRTPDVDAALATGYRPGGRRPAPFFDVVVAGAGGVYSTLTDLAAFTRALAGHDEAPTTLLQAMRSPRHAVHPALPGIGLAFMLRDVGGHRVVAHGGSVPGFGTAVAAAPDAGVGVCVCTNENATSPIVAKAEIIADALLRDLLGVDGETDGVDGADGAPRAVPDGGFVPDGRWTAPPDPRLHARAWQHHGGEVVVSRRSDDTVTIRSAFGALRRGAHLVCRSTGPDGTVFTGESRVGPVTAVFVPGERRDDEVLYLNGAPVPMPFRRADGPTRRTRYAATAVAGAAAAAAVVASARVLSRR